MTFIRMSRMEALRRSKGFRRNNQLLSPIEQVLSDQKSRLRPSDPSNVVRFPFWDLRLTAKDHTVGSEESRSRPSEARKQTQTKVWLLWLRVGGAVAASTPTIDDGHHFDYGYSVLCSFDNTTSCSSSNPIIYNVSFCKVFRRCGGRKCAPHTTLPCSQRRSRKGSSFYFVVHRVGGNVDANRRSWKGRGRYLLGKLFDARLGLCWSSYGADCGRNSRLDVLPNGQPSVQFGPASGGTCCKCHRDEANRSWYWRRGRVHVFLSNVRKLKLSER
jgi:hypothetical protein